MKETTEQSNVLHNYYKKFIKKGIVPIGASGKSLHPTELPNDYERHEYLSALYCAIGGLVQDRNQASTDRERALWSKEIAVLQKIVQSIRQGEYRLTDDSIDEGIDAEADRCSSHIDCGDGGAA